MAELSPELLRERLEGFVEVLEAERDTWNVAAIGVGVVLGNELIDTQCVGFRDYENKLPMTSGTLIPIASNTKLITSVACGLLVAEGELTWDEPVKRAVPAITFSTDHLNLNVSLRDMLAHRTGITRHDRIWYKSNFSRAELFDRLRLLEPQAPLRTQFIYNNLMYAAAGYLIELVTGLTWEQFVVERILNPLQMNATRLSIPHLLANPNHGVPYGEDRDGFQLKKLPHYEQIEGCAPAGALISNLEEVARWMGVLLNDGNLEGRHVVPSKVIAATMEPALATPNVAAETKGYWENLNAFAGMGRMISVYRGHLLASHGGYLDGFHTQVSIMPREKIGVAAFVIGDHAGALPNVLSFNLYERLLGLDLTPWSSRLNAERLSAKEALIQKRKSARDTPQAVAVGRNPAHPLEDYAGAFESTAYGFVQITLDLQLRFEFNGFRAPLEHVWFERFDTPDDEHFGKFSLNFFTNSDGDVEKVVLSLDGSEQAFTRVPVLPSDDVMRKLAGNYRLPDASVSEVELRPNGDLVVTKLSQVEMKLTPYRGLTFKCKDMPELSFTFQLEDGVPLSVEMTDSTGTLTFPRISG